MREILFRGKSKKNGEWVTGRGVDVNWVDAYIIIPQEDVTVGWCGVDEIEVDASTVCQYTGLTDKNGTKIFEGDILKTFDRPFDNEIVVVSWIEYSYNLGLKVYAKDYEGIALLRGYDLEKSEIIGNIYDNLELLEV